MKTDICCVFNFGSHYRTSIYQLMDRELKCDFYFGDKIRGGVESMDYNSLKGYKKSLKNIWICGNYYWQIGSLSIMFKPYKYIIMEGEPYCISSWFMLLIAKLLGKKTYPWTHGWYGREGKLKILIKKAYFRMAYHIFLYGDYAKELMMKEGFAADKLSCIYNSLDYENQLNIRRRLCNEPLYKKHFKNSFSNLIFVGRLTYSKRLDLLLNALGKLNASMQAYNLTLIGEGEQKDDLIELTNKLGLQNNVWFYEACYDEKQLSKLIFNADLCISPGNVGLTAIHAMTFGTPVLTHNNYAFQGPEFEAVKEGITGSYFEYENCDSLVESINEWFSSKKDRELIRKQCYNVIDKKYNPYYQITILKRMLW